MPHLACNFCGRFYKSCGGTELRNLFFSFRGRLGRLGSSSAAWLLESQPEYFLSSASRCSCTVRWWWLGLLITIIPVATLLVCYASLVVRRLHEMNFSGYHAIWVVPVEIFGVLVPAALTSEGVDSRASMTRFSRSSP